MWASCHDFCWWLYPTFANPTKRCKAQNASKTTKTIVWASCNDFCWWLYPFFSNPKQKDPFSPKCIEKTHTYNGRIGWSCLRWFVDNPVPCSRPPLWLSHPWRLSWSSDPQPSATGLLGAQPRPGLPLSLHIGRLFAAHVMCQMHIPMGSSSHPQCPLWSNFDNIFMHNP